MLAGRQLLKSRAHLVGDLRALPAHLLELLALLFVMPQPLRLQLELYPLHLPHTRRELRQSDRTDWGSAPAPHEQHTRGTLLNHLGRLALEFRHLGERGC